MEMPTTKVDTTLGELVELLTQLAQEVDSSEEESYRLASLTLTQLLRDHGIRTEHTAL